ncbi:2-hydroxyhepta-2,4-diene-1,7-dioate isomerase, partial [Microbispora bryophytorum]
MKLLRVGPVGAERPCVLGPGGRVLDVSSLTADIDGAFLAGGGVERVRSALAEGRLPEAGPFERVGAPVARPGKVVCIGLNYSDHAEETG